MVVDAYLVYSFIRRLVTPFEKYPAYTAGLIDKDGNFLKSRNRFTPDERKALPMFDIMIINLKKLIAKFPFGKTRIATIAAALMLLRSKPSGKVHEEYIDEMFSLEEELHRTMEEVESVMEAPLLPLGKKTRFSIHTGGEFKQKRHHKNLGPVDDRHDVWHNYGDNKNKEEGSYHVVNNKSKKIVGTIAGSRNGKTKVLDVKTVDSTGKGPKMHNVYHKIMQSDHASAIVGHSHSEGGQKIWQRLSSMRGVSVHGWHKGKPVNLDPKNSEETHLSDDDLEDFPHDKASKEIYHTKLVASLHKKKTIKEDGVAANSVGAGGISGLGSPPDVVVVPPKAAQNYKKKTKADIIMGIVKRKPVG